MVRKVWNGVRRFVLWDYPRASWQYDVMVALILAFVFLTPRDWFRDQPRPATIVALEGHQGSDVYWIAPELLASVPEAELPAKTRALLQERLGRRVELIRVDAIRDAEDEVSGYMALVRR